MSRFYASIQGARGQATRTGHASSGMSGHIRGWNVGVRIDGRDLDGADVFDVYATGGSNGGRGDLLIATVSVSGGTMPAA